MEICMIPLLVFPPTLCFEVICLYVEKMSSKKIKTDLCMCQKGQKENEQVCFKISELNKFGD